MNQKTIKLSAFLLGASVTNAVAATSSLLGNFSLGANLAGGFDVMEYKAGDKNILGVELTSDEINQANEGLENLKKNTSTGMAPSWSLGASFAYDFGKNETEFIGCELGASWFSNTSKLKKENSRNSTKELRTFSRMGIAIDGNLRFHVFRFEGGSLFITLGVESQFGFMKNYAFTSIDQNGKIQEFKSDEYKQSKNAIEEKIIVTRMHAGNLGLCLSVMDNAICARIKGRLWLTDLINRESEETKEQGYACQSIGKYAFDLSLSIGYNFL